MGINIRRIGKQRFAIPKYIVYTKRTLFVYYNEHNIFKGESKGVIKSIMHYNDHCLL